VNWSSVYEKAELVATTPKMPPLFTLLHVKFICP
jgi:hypothetical protein